MNGFLEFAGSKLHQRQYLFNTVSLSTDVILLLLHVHFFNILINHYRVCEYPFILKHHYGSTACARSLLWVGRTVGTIHICESSCRYTVRCNRADIAVGVSSYNAIEPRAFHGLTHAACHSD